LRRSGRNRENVTRPSSVGWQLSSRLRCVRFTWNPPNENGWTPNAALHKIGVDDEISTRTTMSARTRGWVEFWNRVKDLPERELLDYLVKKCRNGFQMAKKPSRGQKDAWVTLLAEPDKTREGLSPLAMRAVDDVRRRL